MTGRRVVLAALLVAASSSGVAALMILGEPAATYERTDMYQFWYAARTLLDGREPYSVWDWPYPLWTAIPLLPLGALPYAIAAPAWLVLQIALAAAVGGALALRVVRTEPRRDLPVLVAIAFGMQPTWLLIGGGNMTGLLFAAFGGALLAQLSGRDRLSGALLGTLIAKPASFLVAAPALVAVAPRGARARVMVAAVAMAGALIATSILLRPAWIGPWLAYAAKLQGSSGSNATGWTIGRALPAGGAQDLISAASIALAVMAFAWWWAARRPHAVLAVAAAIPISVFVAPHGWSYDQLHLIVTYMVTIELLAARPDRERAFGLVAVATIAVALPWALYARAVSTGNEYPAAVLALFAFAALVAADARRTAVVAPRAPVLRPA